jgi:NAD(P)-dependent dehydrogenase (short-subunit alcohol dehydrogenase family)
MGLVVVTGAAAGLGLAIARRLRDAGDVVVGVDIDEERAARVREDHGLDIVTGDVASPDTLAQVMQHATTMGPLTGWVNNAALALAGTLHSMVEAEVRRVIDVNLLGTYWGSALAVQQFIRQRSGGAIVNISSIQGRVAFPGWPAYGVAKAGVDGLTRYIAVEYGKYGIRANAVAPGAVDTEMNQRIVAESADPDQTLRNFNELHPAGRMGTPEEVAELVEFLLSPRVSFLNGESIALDGGATARCFAYPPDPLLAATYGHVESGSGGITARSSDGSGATP